MRKRNGQKVTALETDDAGETDDADAFLEQHRVLCAVTPLSGTDGLANPDLTDAPLDIDELQVIHALIDTEKFMRKSVKQLGLLRAIEPDTRCFTPIPDTALRWMAKAIDLAIIFRHCLDPDSASYRHIARQNLQLTRALDRFLQLLSAVRASRRMRDKQTQDFWIWPQRVFHDQSAEATLCCPYVDIVGELEEVQRLLKSQDESSDRTKRSNYAKAKKVLNKAFVRSSKLLVLRLDLGFRKGVFQNVVIPENEFIATEIQPDIVWVKKHFAKFLSYLTKFFDRAYLGYIWKLEYGIKKGFHYHLIILLNGQKHQRDVYIAKQLGEHWANVISAGQGGYYNCNAKKWSYRYKGIGMIGRSDVGKREILETKVTKYLVKYDLPFELLKEKKFKQFGTSQV